MIPFYIIGIDTYDSRTLAYCLAKIDNGTMEIVSQDISRNEEEFYSKVNNLSKQYSAKIYK